MLCNAAAIARLLRPRWRMLWWVGLCWGLCGLHTHTGAAAAYLSVRDLAAAGVWTSRTGWSTRLQTCPAGTSSFAGSDEASDCACATGLTGSPCAMCDTSMYKDVLGAGACTVCGVRSTSLPGARDTLECLCEAGYYRSSLNGPCEPCAAGTYKPHTGDAGCVPCPADSTSPAASTLFSQCTCGPGFASQTGFCLRCGVNSYSGGGSVTDTAACTACPDYSTDGEGSASIDDCMCASGYV